MEKIGNALSKLFFVFWMLTFGFQLCAGTQHYKIGHQTLAINDPDHRQTSITAELYYPSVSGGENAAIAENKFPLILFAHGYLQRFDDYRYIWESMVPRGYVFALITTQNGLTIDIDTFAKEISFLFSSLHRENRDTSVFISGHLSQKSALMGHSTGGGAIYLAQTSLPEVTTLVSLAALGKTYGPISGGAAIDIAKNITIPSLILSGSDDCICPPDTYQKPLYVNFGGDKVIVTIRGGDHCGFSISSDCAVAETASCGFSPERKTIPTEKQRELVLSLVIPWFDFYLKGEPRAWKTFQTSLKNNFLLYQIDMQ